MTETPTLRDPRPAADICRAHGWGAGTYLVGDEGRGPEVIEIAAVGERYILAKTITVNGEGVDWAPESLWSLTCRDWVTVPTPTPAAPEAPPAGFAAGPATCGAMRPVGLPVACGENVHGG